MNIEQKKTALKIFKSVCKNGLEEDMYNELKNFQFDDESNYIEAMIDFFEPVEESLWHIHFSAWNSFCNTIVPKIKKKLNE